MARRQHDAYYTEQGLTLELLKYLDLSRYKTILEPCVGDGHIRNIVAQKYLHLQYTTNDINTTKEADFHYDASKNTKLYYKYEDSEYLRDAKHWDCTISVGTCGFVSFLMSSDMVRTHT